MSENHLQKVGYFHGKNTPKKIIIPLWPSYYTPKKLQNIISQTAIKHYNQFRSAITKAIIWLNTTTDTGEKLTVEKRSRKEINNYWTSLSYIYLRLKNNIIQISTSSLYP